MKKRLLFLIVMMCMTFIGFNSQNVRAGEVDILINKLVEKGVITQDDATQLLDEMQKEGARRNEAIKTVASEAAKETADKNKAALPKWVENMTLSGDFRMRYQTEDIDNDGKPSRNRWRIRLRTGLDIKINDKWKADIGLASGGGTDGSDPISRNQTLENEFQAPGLRIDYAYAQYSPTKDIKVSAGKLKNPLYTTKDLIWDSDIRPDGLAATFNFKTSDNLSFFVTPAYFILEEFKTTDDPAMIAIQPGMNLKINESVNFKIAGAYYYNKNVKGSDMSVWSQGTNSRDAAGKWIYDLSSTAFDAELGFKFPSFIKYASVFGEYVKSDADTDNTGWLAGITLGDEKVSEFGKWQFIYNYRNLEKDGWVDWLPDSDFYGGKTGVKGSEFEFTFGLSKNVTFGLDYYLNKPIDNISNKDMSLIQADLLVKF
jgi:polyhydroxyalkanoate synthesis regulator phasin